MQRFTVYTSFGTLKPRQQPNRCCSCLDEALCLDIQLKPTDPSKCPKASTLFVTAMHCTAGGHWFFLPGVNCWHMGKWVLPKQDMVQVAISIRQVARLLRSLHDTFAEASL